LKSPNSFYLHGKERPADSLEFPFCIPQKKRASNRFEMTWGWYNY